jgi:hypothetical protein
LGAPGIPYTLEIGENAAMRKIIEPRRTARALSL